MNYTIFQTPVLSFMLYLFSFMLLKIMGWQVQGKKLAFQKYVMVAAPHTSNWDLPFTLMVGFALRLRAHWMGKHSLFQGPYGFFFKYLGGIPVDRASSHNIVDQMIEVFRKRKEFILIISPEGTRSKVASWKSGYYHIAHGAQVPLVLGFIDYHRKIGGLGPVFEMTGDFHKDEQEIKAFYAPIRGKIPEKYMDYGTEQTPALPEKTRD